MGSEALPSSSEVQSKSFDVKSSPCGKLKPQEEPATTPPPPRTSLAVQAAVLGGSSEEEWENEGRRQSDGENVPVSPLTLLAIQKALDDDDEDMEMRAGNDVQTGASGVKKPPEEGSDEETDEGLKKVDGKGMLLPAGPHLACVNSAQECDTSLDSSQRPADSAHVSQPVSESRVPEEEMSPRFTVANTAFQTSDEAAVKGRKDPVPSESTVKRHSDAPGLQSGGEGTPTPPTSSSSVSRDETYAKVSELQPDLCPSGRKYVSSVLSREDEAECEKGPLS